MKPDRRERRQQDVGPYQFFVLILSLLVLLTLAAEAFGYVSDDSRLILRRVDFAVCVAFFIDFLVSLWGAPNRMRYFVTWGWIDLLSSIPLMTVTQWGRAARVGRVIHVLRGVRSSKELVHFLVSSRKAEGALLSAALITLVVITFSSIAILRLEQGGTGMIQTPGDALWWAFVTATTVGYGDMVPTSTEGRILAAGLMTVGVGLVGAFTAYTATWFLSGGDDRRDRQLAELHSELSEIRRFLGMRPDGVPVVEQEGTMRRAAQGSEPAPRAVS